MSTQEFYSSLSINDKVSILADLRAGLTMKDVSMKHQVSTDQILVIAAKEQSIWDLFKSHYFKLAQGMPLKKGSYPRMENVLYQWYLHHPGRYVNAMFIEKAKSIVSITGEKPYRGNRAFCGTLSWANGFKRRYNITLEKTKNGPKQSAANIFSATPQVLTEEPGEKLNDIKTEMYSNEVNESNNVSEGIFLSASLVEVQINEFENEPFNPSNVIQAPKVNENSVKKSTPIELAVANKSVKSPNPTKTYLPTRTKRLNTMSPNWAFQVFSQALKWAKENPTEEGDVRVLRKLHSRCLLSKNSALKIKEEKA